MTRHDDVHTSPVVQEPPRCCPKLAGMIGDPAVRHMRHHRRFDRQQRSDGRLSGRLPRARRHHHHQQAPHQGRRFFHRHVLDRARAGGDHHQGQLPAAEKGGLPEVPQPGVALSRWSACSSPSAAARSASPSPARAPNGVFRVTVVRGSVEEAVFAEIARRADAFRPTASTATSTAAPNIAPIWSASWRAARSPKRSGSRPQRSDYGASAMRRHRMRLLVDATNVSCGDD